MTSTYVVQIARPAFPSKTKILLQTTRVPAKYGVPSIDAALDMLQPTVVAAWMVFDARSSLEAITAVVTYIRELGTAHCTVKTLV